MLLLSSLLPLLLALRLTRKALVKRNLRPTPATPLRCWSSLPPARECSRWPHVNRQTNQPTDKRTNEHDGSQYLLRE